MFTGIIQCTAPLIAIEEKSDLRTHFIQLPDEMVEGLAIGASVAHNGCCLTVTGINGNVVSFDVMRETLRLTNLGALKIGDEVNIERAARLKAEIGGHTMSGHIICTADLSEISNSDNNRQIWFNVTDKSVMKYILHKGYIGVDGISLTVGEVMDYCFCVYLIPETLARTTLGKKRVGDVVNIEVDPQTQAIVDTVERVLEARELARSIHHEKND